MKCPQNGSRPPYNQRTFHSQIIDNVIKDIKLGVPELANLFENCFPNTLDTTVTISTTTDNKPDTFIITGDFINPGDGKDVMWLRDSSAQVWPYLPYATQDDNLRTLFRGLIGRHARCINIDPYANAFMRDPTERSNLPWAQDDASELIKPGVAERKWEIDSLCYPIRLAHGYWKATGDDTPFDEEWREAMRAVVKTFKDQQRKCVSPYHFWRSYQNENVLSHPPCSRWKDSKGEWHEKNGDVAPTNKVGMIHSGFRPSDDACDYPFLIPSNLFAVKSLRQLVEMGGSVGFDADFCTKCSGLANEIDTAAKDHGKCLLEGVWVWAYEVDGKGNTLFMDDANTPGLLGLPYLGICEMDDGVYQDTRAKILSNPPNPYYFRGSAAQGIGSPHGNGKDWIWPMSLMMEALTSAYDPEIERCLKTLIATTTGTGFMHESFNMNDASDCTRCWFAWANSLFGELVLDVVKRKPHLVV